MPSFPYKSDFFRNLVGSRSGVTQELGPEDNDAAPTDQIPPTDQIRFKLNIRQVGHVDEVQKMICDVQFRLTVFWNDNNADNDEFWKDRENERIEFVDNHFKLPDLPFKMDGRRKAVLKQEGGPDVTIYVPQLALRNCSTFQEVGKPEFHVRQTKPNKLCRWTCEYNASLHQRGFDVKDFPYDVHDIILDVGISVYAGLLSYPVATLRLGPATAEDNERIDGASYGKIEEHVTVPGFHLNEVFEAPKVHEALDGFTRSIWFKMEVCRDHTYYNRNVMTPLLFLHVVAALSLVLPIEEIRGRLAILFAVAFTEIGLRLSLDARLPKVAGKILIQTMVNSLFYTLLLLAVESNLLYFVFVRIIGICEETPVHATPVKNVDGCFEDKWPRRLVYSIDGVCFIIAVVTFAWVLLKMRKGSSKCNALDYT